MHGGRHGGSGKFPHPAISLSLPLCLSLFTQLMVGVVKRLPFSVGVAVFEQRHCWQTLQASFASPHLTSSHYWLTSSLILSPQTSFYTHAHTHAHTHIHTYIHTHKHTYIHIRRVNFDGTFFFLFFSLCLGTSTVSCSCKGEETE